MLSKSLRHVEIPPKEFLYQYFARIPYGSEVGNILVWVGETRYLPHGFPASAILKVWHCGSNFILVYTIVHEKSRTDIRESWPNFPWQYFRSFDRGIVILSVFMAPYCVVLSASRNKSHWKLLTCFAGVGGLSFREHKRRNGQICPFSFEDVILLTVDPGCVISYHRNSSRVGSCQLSSLLGGFRRFHFGWSFDFNRLYSTAVNKVWCLWCGQMFKQDSYILWRFGAAFNRQN